VPHSAGRTARWGDRMVIPGMPAMGPSAGSPAAEQRPPQEEDQADALPKPMDLLKGILGR
jgi:hypothetical protein